MSNNLMLNLFDFHSSRSRPVWRRALSARYLRAMRAQRASEQVDSFSSIEISCQKHIAEATKRTASKFSLRTKSTCTAEAIPRAT